MYMNTFAFFISAAVWDRVITKMKMGSNPQKMIKKVCALFESNKAKFMKLQLDKEQNTNELMRFRISSRDIARVE